MSELAEQHDREVEKLKQQKEQAIARQNHLEERFQKVKQRREQAEQNKAKAATRLEELRAMAEFERTRMKALSILFEAEKGSKSLALFQQILQIGVFLLFHRDFQGKENVSDPTE